jgi:hypothetical protein
MGVAAKAMRAGTNVATPNKQLHKYTGSTRRRRLYDLHKTVTIAALD